MALIPIFIGTIPKEAIPITLAVLGILLLYYIVDAVSPPFGYKTWKGYRSGRVGE